MKDDSYTVCNQVLNCSNNGNIERIIQETEIVFKGQSIVF